MFFKGALLGLIAAFSLGPVFFGVLDVGMRRGALFALAFCFGVLLSDVSVLTLSFFSLSKWIREPELRNAVGTLGGVVLVLFGLYQLLRPAPGEQRPAELNSRDLALYAVRGFVINSINPFVYIFWIGGMSILAVDPRYEQQHYINFFAGTFGTIIVMDLIKSYFSSRLKHLLTKRLTTMITRSVGAGIVFFGLRLLWKTLNP